MPKFQAEVTLSCSGYLTLEASDKKAAGRLVQAMAIGLEYSGCDGDVSMMPDVVDVHLDGISEEEEDD